MRIGYARVSTKGQTVRPQRIALRTAGVDQIIEETRSGISDRPALDKLLSALSPGDELVVTRLDRLGRSMPHLVAVVTDLQARGVDFLSLHEQIDTSTATGKLQLSLFAAFAQFERDLISERTKAGLVAAREAGRLPGRPRFRQSRF